MPFIKLLEHISALSPENGLIVGDCAVRLRLQSFRNGTSDCRIYNQLAK